MNKPDPNKSSKISDAFDDFAGSFLDTCVDVEKLKNVGNLLFEPKDLFTSADEMNRLFRKVCVDNSITEAYFNEKYKQYAIHDLGKTPQAAANNRSNTIKMLKTGERLSWKKFLELTNLVLGLKLTTINISMVNRETGEQSKYELNNNIDLKEKD